MAQRFLHKLTVAYLFIRKINVHHIVQNLCLKLHKFIIQRHIAFRQHNDVIF